MATKSDTPWEYPRYTPNIDNQAEPLTPSQTEDVGGRSWYRNDDGSIHIGGKRFDPIADAPNPKLDVSTLPRCTGREVRGADVWQPSVPSYAGDLGVMHPGPKLLEFTCPACGGVSRTGRYPIPRVVHHERCDRSVIVEAITPLPEGD
jgi:hypothetical protein